jgi:hypothetical protein
MSFSFFRMSINAPRLSRCTVVEPAPSARIRLIDSASSASAIRHQALLRERRLGGKHFDVVADAFAVTRSAGRTLPARSQRLSLLHTLLVDALEQGKLIDRIAHRIGERLVVLLDGDVVVGILAGEFPRSRRRRRSAASPRARPSPARCGKETRSTQALQADERGKIDVGIELGLAVRCPSARLRRASAL